jgi:hypothetical protein
VRIHEVEPVDSDGPLCPLGGAPLGGEVSQEGHEEHFTCAWMRLPELSAGQIQALLSASRTGDAMSNESNTQKPRPCNDMPASLWRFVQVAGWFDVCENTAREIRKNEPDFPEPIVKAGRVELWHPLQFDAWALSRAGLGRQTEWVDGVPASEIWKGAGR